MKQFIKDEFDKLAMLGVLLASLVLLIVMHFMHDKDLMAAASQSYHDAFIAFTALITGQYIRSRKDPPDAN